MPTDTKQARIQLLEPTVSAIKNWSPTQCWLKPFGFFPLTLRVHILSCHIISPFLSAKFSSSVHTVVLLYVMKSCVRQSPPFFGSFAGFRSAGVWGFHGWYKCRTGRRCYTVDEKKKKQAMCVRRKNFCIKCSLLCQAAKMLLSGSNRSPYFYFKIYLVFANKNRIYIQYKKPSTCLALGESRWRL